MKQIYISPKMELFLVEYSKSILESVSAYGDVFSIGDGGDLGETSGVDDFFEY